MNEKILSIIVKARDEASKVFKDLDKTLEKSVDSSKKFAAGMAIVGTAVAAAGTFAVMSSADFEQSLDVMQSVSSATSEQMKEVASTARALGKDITLPGISAKDAALAMVELSKAGLSVNDTLAASKGVLSLAKAGQLETAQAAEITANALNAFSLKGKEASRVADLMAAAANASSANVQDMAFALQMSSAAAASVKVPVEDLTTAIAAMANNGIKGSDAGTSLKAMFMNLIPTTDRAKESMRKLNLDFYDAEGRFVGMREMIKQLQEGTKNLTDEQKALHIENIFGADSMRAANILIKEGVEGYDKLSASVNKAGAAQQLAAAQNAGLKGAIDNVRSTVETLAIDIGTKMIPVLTKVATVIANNLEPVVYGLAKVLADFGPVIVGAIMGGLIPAFVALGISIWTATAPLLPFIAAGAAIGVIVNALVQSFGGWGEVMNETGQALTGIYNAVAPVLLPALTSLWNVIATQLMPALQNFWAQNQDMLIPALQALGYVLGVWVVGSIVVAAEILKVLIGVLSAVINIITALGQIVESVIRFVVSWFHILTGNVSAARDQVNGAVHSMKMVIASIKDAVVNAVSGIGAILIAPFQQAADKIGGFINGIKDKIASLSPGNVAKGIEKQFGIDIPGFATGGFTGRGGSGEVAGIVHRGEYVVPKSQVDQATGQPMIGSGDAVFNMYGNIILGDASSVDRFFERLNAQKEMGSLGVGV